MEDTKNLSPKKSPSASQTSSQVGECESVWLLCGPPFDQRDYMISPSESIYSVVESEGESGVIKKKIKPCDIKIDGKYLIDSQQALKKILQLVRNQCTKPFVNRIKELIFKYLQGCSSGYLVDDLPLMVEIIEYFSRNKSKNPEFAEFTQMILCRADKPPIVEKSSDILRCKDILIDYFTLFGEVLASFEEECFQKQLLENLENLICRRKLSDVSAVKLSSCHQAMQDSQLPYVIASLMETISDNLYISYLELALHITLVSAKAGFTMIQCHALNYVLRRLNRFKCPECTLDLPENTEEEAILHIYYIMLEKSCYLMWSLLTIATDCNEDLACPSEDALRSLRIVLQRESLKKSQRSKDTRNNLAGLIVKLCAVFKDKLPIVQSDLAGDVAIISVATEIGVKDTWLEVNPLGTRKEDYIFKKLMLLCCCLMAENKRSSEIFKCTKVIEGVLCLINSKAKAPWIPSQFIDLFYIGLRTLSELVPIMPEAFVLSQGSARLISTLKWCTEAHFDRNALLETLKTLSIIVTCDNNCCVLDDIVAQDGLKVIFDVSFYLLNIESLKLEDQEKLIRIFISLEKILKSNPKVLEKYEESCVNLSIMFLERILKNLNCDSKLNQNVLVSFGAFLWESVAFSQSSLALFIEKNGVFYLLDVIELSAFPVQMFFLGILVEMTEEGKDVAHLITWRGKNGLGILDLMIDVWRKEEFHNKVRRTKDGLIQDVELPLMTEEQWYLTYQVAGSHICSPSVVEMICSARPKIHALYQFLHKRYWDKTQMSESCYSLYFKQVRPSYQVYIPLIENFLLLKMGEIWFEVLQDVEATGIFQSAFDGNMMWTLIDEKIKWASRIRTIQEEIILKNNVSRHEEVEFYSLLNSCRLAPALEALGEIDFVARTSNVAFQEARKLRQIHDIEKSFTALSIPSDAAIHRTYLYRTKTTATCANYVRIKSEKEVKKVREIFIVSSASSDENIFET